MTSRGFLWRLLAAIALLVGVAVGLNVWMDLYGLFRNAAGRSLKVYGEERNCKYLFTYRYLPENFDALMLGSSVSENIPVDRLAGLRTYNLSLSGGVMTEAAKLGTNALQRGHFKVLLLSLHRYMLESAEEKTNFMVPERYWGAFGSMQLYTASFAYLLDRAGIRRSPFDEYGVQLYGLATPTTQSEIVRDAAAFHSGQSGRWSFKINPRAYHALEELIHAAHEHNVPFVAFTPPMPTILQEATAKRLADFDSAVAAAFGPQDVFIEFNRPEYRFLSDDFANFREGAHLSDPGARKLAGELDTLLRGILARRGAAAAELAAPAR